MPFFKCQSIGCDRDVQVASSFLDKNGKPTHKVVCFVCYVPDNPTTGWLISKASNVEGFSYRKLSTLNKDSKIREYCKKIIGFKESKTSKKEDKRESFIR